MAPHWKQVCRLAGLYGVSSGHGGLTEDTGELGHVLGHGVPVTAQAGVVDGLTIHPDASHFASASREISASPERVFELIADPASSHNGTATTIWPSRPLDGTSERSVMRFA